MIIDPLSNKKWSWRRATVQPFECWVAVVLIINVIAYFSRPNVNPIHELVSPWDTVWAVTYAVAGLLMLIGLTRRRSSNIEAMGLMLLIGGVLVQILVFASLGVQTLSGTWNTIAILVALILFAGRRLRTLAAASRIEDHRGS